ncbi:MAG: hypothetical protein EOO86_03570 [Pedobacter sp.]|nr:MAG: hypothetical protein EOO86_03570 [Pedobacter sp.]
MVKITLISLLLHVKFMFNLINPIFSTEIVGNDFTSIPKTSNYKISLNKSRPLKIISKGDILISEVLFNPRTGGVDFVEIYNHSNHEIDLKELQLANANTGSVILLSNNQVLDRLDYNAKIHHPLIQDEDGVSLERVSFSLSTNDPDNFKSAAASAGFATPTYKNSQERSGDESYARLLSKTFSPDGDNFEDMMTLEYQVAQPASLATANIYSDKGKLVKKLMKNQTIGTNGNLTWDGVDEQGQKAAIGIYIVLFDVFDLNGNTKRFKNTCVLAGRLN